MNLSFEAQVVRDAVSAAANQVRPQGRIERLEPGAGVESTLGAIKAGWILHEAGVRHTDRGPATPPEPAPRAVSAQLFVAAIRAGDVLILAASGLLASLACGVPGEPGSSLLIALAATLATLFALSHLGAYAPNRLRDLRHRLCTLLPAILLGSAASLACLAMIPDQGEGSQALRFWPLAWLLAAAGLTTAAASLSARSAQTLANADRLARRVAVVGVNAYSRAFIDRVAADPSQAAAFVGLYDDAASPDTAPGDTAQTPGDIPVLGQIEDLVARSQRERIDAIVLALPMADLDRIIRARAALRTVTSDIYMGAEILDLACKAGQVDRLGPNAVIKIGSRPLTEWQTLQKGAFDAAIATLLLAAALPFLAVVALAIKLTSPGPVLFRQPRLGFNNTMFSVFKFRTMYHHLADVTADRQTTRGDPRITRIGRILRRTSLDEVPQLLNVLRGEMSLVGPRPHAPNTKAGDQLFHDAVADYALRHRVKPGITGLAQVNGWRGETRTREQIEQRVAHDLHYIDNWSMTLDLKILVLTALREFNSKVAF